MFYSQQIISVDYIDYNLYNIDYINLSQQIMKEVLGCIEYQVLDSSGSYGMLQEPGAIQQYFHILLEASSRAGIPSIPVASRPTFREDFIAYRRLTGPLGKGLARCLLPSPTGSSAQLLDPIHVSSHHWRLGHPGPKKRRSPKNMGWYVLRVWQIHVLGSGGECQVTGQGAGQVQGGTPRTETKLGTLNPPPTPVPPHKGLTVQRSQGQETRSLSPSFSDTEDSVLLQSQDSESKFQIS